MRRAHCDRVRFSNPMQRHPPPRPLESRVPPPPPGLGQRRGSFLIVVHEILPFAMLQGGSVLMCWLYILTQDALGCIWCDLRVIVAPSSHRSLHATWGETFDFQTHPKGFFSVLNKISTLGVCWLRPSGLLTSSDHWDMSLKVFYPCWELQCTAGNH